MSRRRQLQTPDMAGAFEGMRSDYQAARDSRYRRRRTGISAQGSGADWHYRSESDWLKILEQARDFDRNDMIVGQTVDRAITNTIQEGMTLDPQTGDSAIDDDLEAWWKDFSEDPDQCDIAGEMSFYDFEQLVPRAMIVDGDIAVLPISDGGCLQAIEAHRIRTPSYTRKDRGIVHGVQLDEFRKREAYWVTKDEVGLTQRLKLNDFGPPIPVRDEEGHRQLFHVYSPKRFSQTRGVSGFAPIFDPVGMFEDVNFARLVQQQIVSCFAIFEEMDRAGNWDGAATAQQQGTQTQETRTDGSTETIEGIAPGMRIRGKPGAKLSGFSPQVPGPAFQEHMRLILTIIGINIGLPLALVLMDAEGSNFSGYRAAVDQARLGFRRNQRSLIKRFHTPVYLWKLRHRLHSDPILAKLAKRSDIKIFKHKWNAPRWPYIEPTKDATADTIRLNGNLASPRLVHSERGGNWFTNTDETVEDYGYAVRKAKREAAAINGEVNDGDPVAWRELLRWSSQVAVNVDMREQPEPDQRRIQE